MKATEKMREFAGSIAAILCIDEPDYDDFDEVSEFIDEHKNEYYKQLDRDWNGRNF